MIGKTLLLACLRRAGAAIALAACAGAATAHPLRAQRPVGAELVRELQAMAGRYPLLAAKAYPPDSAVLVFEDSTLSPGPPRAEPWMFGPPVTAEEAAGCPPPKVLGRRLARLLYRRLGQAQRPRQVIVVVQAPPPYSMSRARMFYHQPELEQPWAGDTTGTR
jgi:hypothetical protein